MVTKEQAVVALKAASDALLEGVRAAGANGVPSGNVYAIFASKGCSLELYEAIVGALIGAGQIRRANHVLYSTKAGA